MIFRKTISKTKYFFHKTFQDFKSFIFGGYQKLPKAQPLIPLSITTTNNQQMHHLDTFYREFSEQWDSDSKKVLQRKKKSIISRKKPMREEDNASKGNSMDNESQSAATKNTQEEKGTEANNKAVNYSCSKSTNPALTAKIKELEMMDVNDVDHVLDIEEIIHYYSRLTCPVYLDLVDTFFMDIYSEFFPPHQPASIRKISPD